jgi:H/ACA ribonucleoprotein complex subunit 4
MVLPLESEGMNLLEETREDPRYGVRPSERTIDELLRKGLVILDKPHGPTSHQAVSWIKRILAIDKAGHHGTLDPNTTGVLPVALGDAVKLLDTTLHGGKEYLTLFHLHSPVNRKTLESVLSDFTDEIYQMVPVRSAVKRGLRTRRIEYIKILDTEGNDSLLLIGCESGTYIRTLLHDIGEVVGSGGNMAELRRTRSGRIREDRCVTLQELRDAWELHKEGNDELLRKVIRPAEDLVDHLKRIVLKDSAVDAVCHGAPVGVPGVAGIENKISTGDTISILTQKGELVALAKADMDTVKVMKSRKGQAASPARVIMDPGTYPRSWKSRSAGQG